jgi:hypothetical protein
MDGWARCKRSGGRRTRHSACGKDAHHTHSGARRLAWDRLRPARERRCTRGRRLRKVRRTAGSLGNRRRHRRMAASLDAARALSMRMVRRLGRGKHGEPLHVRPALGRLRRSCRTRLRGRRPPARTGSRGHPLQRQSDREQEGEEQAKRGHPANLSPASKASRRTVPTPTPRDAGWSRRANEVTRTRRLAGNAAVLVIPPASRTGGG